MIKKIIMIMIFKLIILYGQEQSYDPIEITLNSKGLFLESYKAFYDFDKDEVFINLQDYLNTIDAGSLKIKNLKIVGVLENDSYSINIPKEYVNYIQEDVYISPNNMIELFKDENNGWWDPNRFILTINPNNIYTKYDRNIEVFKQKYIISDKKGNEAEYEEVLTEESKWINPGILGFRYSYYDFLSPYSENQQGLYINYASQILKGDFYVESKILPETNLDYIQWRVPDFYKDYNLYLGDTGFQVPSGIPGGNIRGLTISKDDNFGVNRNNRILIQGESYGANYAELYLDGKLIDFQTIITGQNRFFFNEPQSYQSSNFLVKLYLPNGNVREENITILSDSTLLEKYKSDFVIQYGENKYNNKTQAQAQFKYGLFNNFTMGIGGYLIEDDYFNYNILSLNPVLNTPIGLFYGNFYQNFDDSGLSMNVGYQKKLRDFGIYSNYERWEKSMAFNQNYTEQYEVGFFFPALGGNINIDYKRFFSIGEDSIFTLLDIYDDNSFLENDFDIDDLIYFDFLKGMKSRWNNEVEADYNIWSFSNWNFRLSNKYIWNDTNSSNISEFNVTYGGYKNLNFSADIGNVLSKNSDNNSKSSEMYYNLSISNQPNYSKNQYYRWEVKGGYSEQQGFIAGLYFNVYLDSFFNIEVPIEHYDGENSVGVSVEKYINLSSPKKTVKYTTVKDGFIEGTIYYDKNGNQKFDSTDYPLEGVEIIADGKKGTSDKNGKYCIESITSDVEISVSINHETLEAGLISSKPKIYLKTRRASKVNLNISIVDSGFIDGYITEKVDGIEKILARNSKGQVISSQSIAKNGTFMFSNLPPETYTFETLFTKYKYKNKVILEPGDYIEEVFLKK